MTNMATMPIYAKNLKKIFFSRTNRSMTLKLVCSFVYASTTKIVQIMTLDWPWPILHQGQSWLHRLLYGRKWIFFLHSAKWVNEVEWVSKIKVILLPWPKVIQISKLNVWLWSVYSGERFRTSWPCCLNFADINFVACFWPFKGLILGVLKEKGFTFRGRNSVIFIFATLPVGVLWVGVFVGGEL